MSKHVGEIRRTCETKPTDGSGGVDVYAVIHVWVSGNGVEIHSDPKLTLTWWETADLCGLLTRAQYELMRLPNVSGDVSPAQELLEARIDRDKLDERCDELGTRVKALQEALLSSAIQHNVAAYKQWHRCGLCLSHWTESNDGVHHKPMCILNPLNPDCVITPEKS